MMTNSYKTMLVFLSLAVLAGCADTRKLSSLQSEFNETVRKDKDCRDPEKLTQLDKNLDCAESFNAIFLGIAEEANKTIDKRGKKDAITVGLYNIAALALWQGSAKTEEVAIQGAEGYDLCRANNNSIMSQTPRNCALLQAAGWLATADKNLGEISNLHKEFVAIRDKPGENEDCQAELLKKPDDGTKSKKEELSDLIKSYESNVYGDRKMWSDSKDNKDGLHKSVTIFFTELWKDARRGSFLLRVTAETCSGSDPLKTDKACECLDNKLTADECGVTDANPLAYEIFQAICLDNEAKKRAGIGG